MAWQGWATARPTSCSPRSTTRRRPIQRERRPGQRVVAGDRRSTRAGGSTSPTTPTRRATTTSCSAPGAPTARSGSVAAVAVVAEVRGAAERGGRPAGAGLGRLRGADRRTGARTPRTSSKGEGTTLYRASAVRVRCVDGDRLLDAPDPVAGAAGAAPGDEQLPPDRRRPLGPGLARLPPSPGRRGTRPSAGPGSARSTSLAGKALGGARRSCPAATGCSTTARRSSSPATARSWSSTTATAASRTTATRSITACTSPP